MKLFLLRHTEAAYGGPDPDRPLSRAGTHMARDLAKFIASKPYYSFKKIWCSPYLRARQTAQPFAESFSANESIELKDCLVPGADPHLILREVQECDSSVLLIGHNPHLSILVAKLMELDHGFYPLPFKKGALFVFKRDPYSDSGFTLSACLPPAAIGLKL